MLRPRESGLHYPYRRTDMTENSDNDTATTESSLDRAASMGPLPGVAAEDAAAERGEDHSRVPEDDEPRGGLLGHLVRNRDDE